MTDNNDNEKDILADDEDTDNEADELDISGRDRISTTNTDPDVQTLHKKYKKGRLNVQPDYQRRFVWDPKRSSLLIESALLRIPLPAVYLAEGKDGTTSVIDGQQRLTSFFKFLDNKLELTGLQTHQGLNGKKFRDIPADMQGRVEDCPIRVITFLKDSDGDLQFEIFGRLNSGSVSLNAQELRNCIYHGPYNDLLRELSGNPTYMKLMGYSGEHKRMMDVQRVLRFAAFHFQGYLNYTPPMKKFLNSEMDARKNISDDDAKKLTAGFKQALSLVNSMLGENAFKRFRPGNTDKSDGYWEKQFNSSLYDVLMYTLARADRNLVMNNLGKVRDGFIDLMSDKEFGHSIESSTSATKQVTTRFDKWRAVMGEVLANKRKEPRCFPPEIKKQLYAENPTCGICGNRIEHIDDAAVDHIEQYWLGGKAIPENARLTHRYCNNARPRKERKE